jgi:hypothetical protein
VTKDTTKATLIATRGYLRRKQLVRLEQSYADQEDGKRFGSDIF